MPKPVVYVPKEQNMQPFPFTSENIPPLSIPHNKGTGPLFSNLPPSSESLYFQPGAQHNIYHGPLSSTPVSLQSNKRVHDSSFDQHNNVKQRKLESSSQCDMPQIENEEECVALLKFLLDDAPTTAEGCNTIDSLQSELNQPFPYSEYSSQYATSQSESEEEECIELLKFLLDDATTAEDGSNAIYLHQSEIDQPISYSEYSLSAGCTGTQLIPLDHNDVPTNLHDEIGQNTLQHTHTAEHKTKEERLTDFKKKWLSTSYDNRYEVIGKFCEDEQLFVKKKRLNKLQVASAIGISKCEFDKGLQTYTAKKNPDYVMQEIEKKHGADGVKVINLLKKEYCSHLVEDDHKYKIIGKFFENNKEFTQNLVASIIGVSEFKVNDCIKRYNVEKYPSHAMQKIEEKYGADGVKIVNLLKKEYHNPLVGNDDKCEIIGKFFENKKNFAQRLVACEIGVPKSTINDYIKKYNTKKHPNSVMQEIEEKHGADGVRRIHSLKEEYHNHLIKKNKYEIIGEFFEENKKFSEMEVAMAIGVTSATINAQIRKYKNQFAYSGSLL